MHLYNPRDLVTHWVMTILPKWFNAGPMRILPNLEQEICGLEDWPADRSRRLSRQKRAFLDARNLYQYEIMCSDPEFPFYDPKGFHKDYYLHLKRQIRSIRRSMGNTRIDIQHLRKAKQLFGNERHKHASIKDVLRLHESILLQLEICYDRYTEIEAEQEQTQEKTG